MWTDLSYVAVAAVNAVLRIHYGVFEIAVPLGLVTNTRSPHWTVTGPLLATALIFGLGSAALLLIGAAMAITGGLAVPGDALGGGATRKD